MARRRSGQAEKGAPVFADVRIVDDRVDEFRRYLDGKKRRTLHGAARVGERAAVAAWTRNRTGESRESIRARVASEGGVDQVRITVGTLAGAIQEYGTTKPRDGRGQIAPLNALKKGLDASVAHIRRFM